MTVIYCNLLTVKSPMGNVRGSELRTWTEIESWDGFTCHQNITIHGLTENSSNRYTKIFKRVTFLICILKDDWPLSFTPLSICPLISVPPSKLISTTNEHIDFKWANDYSTIIINFWKNYHFFLLCIICNTIIQYFFVIKFKTFLSGRR